MPTVLAIAAHPDDIEFVMAGTLLLLGGSGWELHYLNVSTGNLGSTTMSPAKTAQVRRREARAAAKALGAVWHAPFLVLRRVLQRNRSKLAFLGSACVPATCKRPLSGGA